MAKQDETKFVVEYQDNGKLEARWHYDLSVSKVNPILVEQFNLPREVAKKKKSKSKAHAPMQSLSEGNSGTES
jgi:hypothetical protein